MAFLRYFCFLCNVLWPICWHCKILIFDVSLDINGQLRKKVKKLRVYYMIITLPEAKRFMFYHVFSFENGYRFKILRS